MSLGTSMPLVCTGSHLCRGAPRGIAPQGRQSQHCLAGPCQNLWGSMKAGLAGVCLLLGSGEAQHCPVPWVCMSLLGQGWDVISPTLYCVLDMLICCPKVLWADPWERQQAESSNNDNNNNSSSNNNNSNNNNISRGYWRMQASGRPPCPLRKTCHGGLNRERYLYLLDC